MRRFISSIGVIASLLAAVALPASGATLFGLVDTGELFSSTDWGATWEVHARLPVPDAVALAAALSADEIFLATRTGTLYFSDDGGTDWVAVGAVPASDVVALAIRTDGALVLLTQTGVVWVSADGGVTFSVSSALTAPDFISMTRDPSGDLYALTETGGVYASEKTQDGASWLKKGILTVPDAVEIVSNGGGLYALVGTGEVWRSTDRGTTWLTIGALSQVHMGGLVLGQDGTLFAATREGEVASSRDGMNWEWVGVIDQLNVVALASDLPVSGVPEDPGSAPRLTLGVPWPNPWVGGPGEIRIPLGLARAGTVNLDVLDAQGRLVTRRPPERFSHDEQHTVAWNPERLPSGVYFIRAAADGETRTQRVVVAE